ncbi:hypothetical protein EDC19_1501 [Natranaerovirga hydrolytica]|uniref:DUF4181 domain-containing protein n=1 Tax=Natranaerovirga hydrolytica TaxID=680378 RepID=A0A4R1MMH4_9FIRM|nr:hypothetical protein EDC19_1501 [Natranaerovirga hydrolytica]
MYLILILAISYLSYNVIYYFIKNDYEIIFFTQNIQRDNQERKTKDILNFFIGALLIAMIITSKHSSILLIIIIIFEFILVNSLFLFSYFKKTDENLNTKFIFFNLVIIILLYLSTHIK